MAYVAAHHKAFSTQLTRGLLILDIDTINYIYTMDIVIPRFYSVYERLGQFASSKGDKPLGGGDPDKEANFSAIDELMEEKLKYGLDDDLDAEALGGLDEDEGNVHDDETFGDSTGDVGKDFDFTAGSAFFSDASQDAPKPIIPLLSSSTGKDVSVRTFGVRDGKRQQDRQQLPGRPFLAPSSAPSTPPQQPPQKLITVEELEGRMMLQSRPTATRPPLTLAELEAQMMATRISSQPETHINSYTSMHPPPPIMMQDPRRPMTIEQLEAALKSGSIPPQFLINSTNQNFGATTERPLTVEEIEVQMRSEMVGRPGAMQPHTALGRPSMGMPPISADGRPRPPQFFIHDGRPIPFHSPSPPFNMYVVGPPYMMGGPPMRPPVPPVAEVEGVLRHLASTAALPNPRELDILLASQRYIDPTPAENDVASKASELLARLPPALQQAFFGPPPQRQFGGPPPHLQQQQQQQQRPHYHNRIHRLYRDDRSREERYNGLMTQYEKETIAKIQIAQLVTENPYHDDFYYQVFRDLVSAKDAKENINQKEEVSSKDVVIWQQSLLMKQSRVGSNGLMSQEMQSQMKRLIEGRKQRPKGTSYEREGALGKIAVGSVRTPKQALQVQGSLINLQKAEPSNSATLSRRRVLLEAERIYSVVLKLEHLQREDHDSPVWEEDYKDAVNELWLVLGCSEPVDVNMPHPFVSYLSVTKGKRVMPRAMQFLSPDQTLTLVGTLLVRAESVDVFSVQLGTTCEAVAIFMNETIPAIMNFVLQISLPVLNALVRSMLERHTVTWIVSSRVGLAFLTMFLSRAEMLKQDQASESDTTNWTELYNYLFGSLVSRFASLFPSSANGSPSLAEDEDCVWQFLASLAVAATTIDHQRQLVTEVRDKVREAAIKATKKAAEQGEGGDAAKELANVDMFLSALSLGVTATQLATMS
ncbi:hypothetical protein SeLEV6574_g07439 [Synchytrium endobioticum]|uniref:mRNA decay factor PAT1 domain-containing protein n=1 Tax=Synchytrium endobioticum TaxID=286115 RepID=A0A507CI60_9FUNG|nr:hypothetical protein SeLEV6574_g07439 [Synchytrium endobioticum]